MAKVLKFKDHSESYKQAEEVIERILNPIIKESSTDDSHIKKILKSFSNDLKFNYKLVFTFGAGIRAMFPIVENLIKNGNLKIDLNEEGIVLLCLAAVSIIYLEESKNKTGEEKIECPDCKGSGYDSIDCQVCDGEGCDECEDESCPACDGKGYVMSEVTKKDTSTILEELKLRGIGNGIVKKLVKCLQAIQNIIKVIFKNTSYVVGSLIEMFSYTAILIPTMNAISWWVGNYKFDIDSLPKNILSLGVGITGFLAKNGFNYLVNRIKDKYHISINPDLERPTAVRSYDIKDGESDNKGANLIKEQ